MKFCLIRKAHARHIKMRHGVHETGIETELVREIGFLFEFSAIVFTSLSEDRGVRKSGNAREFALDFFFTNNPLDLVNRAGPSVPDGLSVIASDILHHRFQRIVGHIREMSSGVTGVDRGRALPFD